MYRSLEGLSPTEQEEIREILRRLEISEEEASRMEPGQLQQRLNIHSITLRNHAQIRYFVLRRPPPPKKSDSSPHTAADSATDLRGAASAAAEEALKRMAAPEGEDTRQRARWRWLWPPNWFRRS